jgi:uncharacterized repeat protein (TIGR04042 family)
MPAVEFTLRWPDGTWQQCMSPSSIVREHLRPGTAFAVSDLVARTAAALAAASGRVRERYGFACTAAAAQQAAIEDAAERYVAIGGVVEVVSVGGVTADGADAEGRAA